MTKRSSDRAGSSSDDPNGAQKLDGSYPCCSPWSSSWTTCCSRCWRWSPNPAGETSEPVNSHFQTTLHFLRVLQSEGQRDVGFTFRVRLYWCREITDDTLSWSFIWHGVVPELSNIPDQIRSKTINGFVHRQSRQLQPRRRRSFSFTR